MNNTLVAEFEDMSGYEGRVLELATHEWDRASTETHTKQSQLVNPVKHETVGVHGQSALPSIVFGAESTCFVRVCHVP